MICAQAQNDDERFVIEKGTWYTSGNLSVFNSQSESENLDFGRNQEASGFTISPILGYTLNKNFIVGTGVSYSSRKSDLENLERGTLTASSTTKIRVFSIFPYARLYKGLGKHLGVFVQGELSYSRNWFENEEENLTQSEDTQNSYFIGIRPGLSYFISKKLALETNIGSLGYSRFDSNTSNSETSSGSNFHLSLNTSDIFLGLAHYF